MRIAHGDRWVVGAILFVIRTTEVRPWSCMDRPFAGGDGRFRVFMLHRCQYAFLVAAAPHASASMDDGDSKGPLLQSHYDISIAGAIADQEIIPIPTSPLLGHT